MAGETILLIDDDATLRELLADQLHTAGYRTREAADGTIGLRLAEEATPNLIVLDVMMPGMSGWEVCEHIRAKSRVPIILLTAKGEEFDKLRGFRLGIDDYVTKPFSFAELVARVGALLTRAQFAQSPTHTLTSNDLTIDFDQKHVAVNGRPIDLTPTEYRLLETLARRAHPQQGAHHDNGTRSRQAADICGGGSCRNARRGPRRNRKSPQCRAFHDVRSRSQFRRTRAGRAVPILAGR